MTEQAPGGSGALKADSPVLQTAAGHVDSTNEAISGQLTYVRGVVDQLAGASWQGSAATAFARVMTDWDAAVARLNGALAGIADQLRVNSSNYDAEEDANTAAINRVGSAGPLHIS